jgi:hypothetical protein
LTFDFHFIRFQEMIEFFFFQKRLKTDQLRHIVKTVQMLLLSIHCRLFVWLTSFLKQILY